MHDLRGTTVYKAREKNKLFTEIFSPVNKMGEKVSADQEKGWFMQSCFLLYLCAICLNFSRLCLCIFWNDERINWNGDKKLCCNWQFLLFELTFWFVYLQNNFITSQIIKLHSNTDHKRLLQGTVYGTPGWVEHLATRLHCMPLLLQQLGVKHPLSP